MATKLWTATADFGNATDLSFLDNAIKTRHQGSADGSLFSTSHYPDADSEMKSGWLMKNTAGNSSSMLFTDCCLNALCYPEEDFDYTRHSETILKNTTFSMHGKSAIATQAGALACATFGFFDADSLVNNLIKCEILAGTSVKLEVIDSTGTSDADTDTANYPATVTDFWWRLRGDGTDITFDVYSTVELFDAASDGDDGHCSVAVADVSGTVTCNRFGIRATQVAGSAAQVLRVDYIDGDACDWYSKWHEGNLNDQGFCKSNMPDASAETKSGWTMTLAGGATSAAEFPRGGLRLDVKREDSATKIFKYEKPTTSNVLKDTSFSMSGSFKHGALTGALTMGFYNSASEFNENSIHARMSDAVTTLQVRDSVGGNDSDTSNALSVSTWDWWRLRGDGTNITFDVYSTENLFNAASTGDVADCSVSVAAVTGTVTCNRFGVRNVAAAGETFTSIVKFGFINGNACEWYAADEVFRANCVDNDFPALALVDYSTFDFNDTGTGSVLFDLRKKATALGSYIVDDNSGSHYTAAQIQALDDEDLYGLGVINHLTATVNYSVDDVSVDYVSDSSAPEDMADVNTSELPYFDQKHRALSWNDPADVGETGLAYVELRRKVDEDAYQYLCTDTLSGETQGGTPLWSTTHDDHDGEYTFRTTKGDDSAVISRMNNFVDRNVVYTTGVNYWARGVDGNGNIGGWVQFNEVVLSGGGGAWSRSAGLMARARKA